MEGQNTLVDEVGSTYLPNQSFDQPVKVGDRKSVKRNDLVIRVGKDHEQTAVNNPTALVERLFDIEDQFQCVFLEREKMKLVNLANGVKNFLGIECDGKYYVIPDNDSSKIVLKRISKLLGIPTGYAAKSGASLFKVNANFWLKMKEFGVYGIYDKNSIDISLVNGDEKTVIKAHNLWNVVKAPKFYKDGFNEEITSVDTLIPSYASLMKNVVDGVGNSLKELGVDGGSVALAQYSDGYSGHTQNFSRLNFEGFDINVGGDVYKPSITISNDFYSGDGGVLFSLQRLVCVNGVTVSLEQEKMSEFTRFLVQNAMDQTGYEEGSRQYRVEKSSVERRIARIFSPEGIKVNMKSMAYINSDVIKSMVSMFLRSIDDIKVVLEKLAEPLDDVVVEKFVDAIQMVGLKMGIQPKILNLLALEYVSESMGDMKNIKSALDAMNFITYVAQMYDVNRLIDIEGKAFGFALALRELFVKRSEQRLESRASVVGNP